MIDIVAIGQGPGGDLRVFDAQTSKAANVLSVQIGYLEWEPDFGIDLEFFIQENFRFQNESFKSYLIQRLSESNVNVASVVETIDKLFRTLTITVGDSKNNSEGFIA